MHEMGIVIHVAKTLEETARENNIDRIEEVTLQVGEVSGIMTELFVDAWDYFKKKHPILEEAQLKLETTPAITYCEDCQGQYETVKHGKTCPHCGSTNTYLLTGNECIIKEILVP